MHKPSKIAVRTHTPSSEDMSHDRSPPNTPQGWSATEAARGQAGP